MSFYLKTTCSGQRPNSFCPTNKSSLLKSRIARTAKAAPATHSHHDLPVKPPNVTTCAQTMRFQQIFIFHPSLYFTATRSNNKIVTDLLLIIHKWFKIWNECCFEILIPLKLETFYFLYNTFGNAFEFFLTLLDTMLPLLDTKAAKQLRRTRIKYIMKWVYGM